MIGAGAGLVAVLALLAVPATAALPSDESGPAASAADSGNWGRVASAAESGDSESADSASGHSESGDSAPAPPAEAFSDELGSPRARPGAAVPGEIIVKWKPGASAQQRSRARSAEQLDRGRPLDLIGGEVAGFPPDRGDPAHVAARLSRDPRVAYAEPNFLVGSHAEPPDDALFDGLWGLHNTGQTIEGQAGTAGTDIGALEAWETTRGDDSVTVAVIDTGTDLGHPDLADSAWTNPAEVADGTDTDGNGFVDDLHGWDFVNDDATVFDPDDGDAHGTHVSGTVAGVADNAVGVSGVAPQVKVMPLKFLSAGGFGDFGDAIQAIEYAADNGAEIANTSWGGPSFSEALRDAIEASGMVVVAAAGNSGQDNDQTAEYPCNYDLDTVLCVTGVDNTGALPDFANTGSTTVAVGAPGVDVLSTVPRGPLAPVALEVDDPDTGHQAMFWGFGLEQAVGADARADLLGRALADHLGVAAAEPVLLVDDDESDSGRWPDTRSSYTEALDESGYTDVTVETVPTDQSGPTAAQMAGHIVVWFTGLAAGHPDSPTTLTGQDQAELVEFLQNGGRLLLAGQDAVFRIEGSELVTEYLHADVVAEVSGRAAEGGPDSVYADRGYDLAGSESPTEVPSPFIKHAEPASGAAVEALILPAKPYDEAYEHFDGTSMAAPHASGVAALLASHRPGLGAAGLVGRVAGTVEPLASLDGVTATGGMVNAANALEVSPPGAPTEVSAVAGDGQATVSWQAPADDGGAAIASYVVRSESEGVEVVVDGEAAEATVAGLTNGVTYEFTVAAVNEAGEGPTSTPSNPVTPAVPEPCGADRVPPASFTDVSATNPHRAAIDCVVWYAIALGTTDETYSPRVQVRRDQMASFLARAIDASDADLPDGADTFDDVAGNPHRDNIARLAEAGIVQGVDADHYAPAATVTRAQMASFLARAYAFVFEDLPTTETSFTDIDGNTHESNITRVAGAGIAHGTSVTTYSPSQPVLRDQMASFLARTLQGLAEDGRFSVGED